MSILNRFNIQGFEKHFLTLFSGHFIAQSVSLIFSFIIIKIYAIHEIGVYAGIISTCSILAIIAPFGFDSLIMISKTKSNRLLNTSISIFNSIVFCVITWGITLMLKTPISNLLGIDKQSNLLLFIPILTWLMSGVHILSYYHNYLKTYKTIRNANILRSSIYSLVAIGLSIYSAIAFGLLFAQLLAVIGAVIMLYPKAFKKKCAPFFTLTYFSNAFKQSKRYALFYTGSNLLNSLANIGTSVLIISLFNTVITGHYFIAEKILIVPISMLVGALSKVFFKHGHTLYLKHPKELLTLIKQLQKKIALFIIPFLLIASFVLPCFFELLSTKWHEASLLIKYFSFYVFFNSLVSPFTYTFNIINKVDYLFWFNLILGCVKIGSFYLCHLYFNIETTLLISSVALSVCYIGLDIFMKKHIKKRLKNEVLYN